jgi:hypothetical protein
MTMDAPVTSAHVGSFRTHVRNLDGFVETLKRKPVPHKNDTFGISPFGRNDKIKSVSLPQGGMRWPGVAA